jgi:hypothetical protein
MYRSSFEGFESEEEARKFLATNGMPGSMPGLDPERFRLKPRQAKRSVNMHSHERTTLSQKFGFQDSDRGEPEHDSAISYLRQPEILLACFTNHPNSQKVIKQKGFRLEINLIESEKLLTKGTGQYATTLGFLDLFVTFCPCWINDRGEEDTVFCNSIFEVKINKEPIGSVVRQLKFYRESYMQCFPTQKLHRAYLVTRWKLSDVETTSLLQENIFPIFLGEKFTEYLKRPASPSGISALEI